ncbi:MAG TPA: Fe2+-dependent dioxygenase [Quisquiliibacterium sp.]|nr:Fe2+-dependent dioxygenase [Quisquiliibacterium sp.]HPA91563.1 Fe2+-dependent dioxygenase [Quisquiliibacterium sp.]HQD84449.1 Fe2+-dependent dioxygenase [Quisquiliibacterium sp.]HQP65204.1 Fe2+-dependent dioxygenase [Quisquiliibacterium sp.]
MLLHINDLLTPEEVHRARAILAVAPWQDGRATSGEQAALAKNNEQLPEGCEEARLLQELVLRGLERHEVFFSASLPRQVSPPLFNRYGGAANTFGNHVDSAVRFLRNGAGRVRTDISCTLFLADPDEYDGGELVVEDTYGDKRVKLPAGDLVLYPGTSVHRVEPVTRGHRLACFFWIQSMVRSDEQRRLLFDMDMHLRRLRSGAGDADPAVVGLTGTYHNLLRMWVDT